MARELQPRLTQHELQRGLAVGDLSTNSGGFVGIDLQGGTDAPAFVASIEPDLRNWDVNRVQPFVYPAPVHPPQIADIGSMRTTRRPPTWARRSAVASLDASSTTMISNATDEACSDSERRQATV